MDRQATSNLAKTDVLILCGGQGSRLKSILPDRPKVLAEVGGRPFLDIILDSLKRAGFRRVILSVGHLREQIIDYVRHSGHKHVEFCEEEFPLGTGGAIKKSTAFIRSSPFLVLNGDSICRVDFAKLHSFHMKNGGILSMVLARPREIPDYGAVYVDSDGRILRYSEKKSGSGDVFANAGIYLMDRDIFSHWPSKDRFSIELDIFPKILGHGCFGFITEGELIDIGTPERYEQANKMFLEQKIL